MNQPQNSQQISRKSKGIIYTFKKYLTQRKTTLQQYISKLFGFMKTSFSKRQLLIIFQQSNKRMIPQQIDNLFDQLDQNKNSVVFLSSIQNAFKIIQQYDNPKKSDFVAIERAASRRSSRHNLQEIVNILGQIRNAILANDDILEMIRLFAFQNEGYVSKQTMQNILINIEFNKNIKIQKAIQSIFQQNKTLILQQFQLKLDLDRQVRKSLPPSQLKMQIQPMLKSKFLQQKQKQINMKESLLRQSIFSRKSYQEDSQNVPLQNIPKVIQPYFNYGSTLQYSFSHFVTDYLQTNNFFIDNQNPYYSKAVTYSHLAQNFPNYVLFQMAKSVIHRQPNRKGLGQLLQAKDIIQGKLGDCYFLSAVAGVVEKYPQLIYRLFVLQKNPSHIYGVRLFIQGSWRTVLLDASFPVDRNGRLCGAQPHHNQIWVLLLQKAWAKVYGSYDNIHSGYNQQGLNAVSGAPSIHTSTKQNNFAKRIQVQIQKGSIITCATSFIVSQMTERQQYQSGIFSAHAYSLMQIYPKLRTIQGDVTLLKVRNPWGKKQWQGDWSFNSRLWTKQLKNLLNYKDNPNDGSFFMCQNQFRQLFDHVNICRVNLAYKNSSIQLDADRNEFKCISVDIKQKGDYYLTLYQQNPRRYAGRKFQKSKSWIFILRQHEGRKVGVGSKACALRDNTIQATFQVGKYYIIIKVQWKLWQNHRITLTSYGPQKMNFKLQSQVNTINYLSDFIESKSRQGFGQRSFYENYNILKTTNFSIEQGYGYIRINNQQNKIFDLQQIFPVFKGLTLLPPYSMPIELKIFPGQIVTIKFIVDPSQFRYSIKEEYLLTKI